MSSSNSVNKGSIDFFISKFVVTIFIEYKLSPISTMLWYDLCISLYFYSLLFYFISFLHYLVNLCQFAENAR